MIDSPLSQAAVVRSALLPPVSALIQSYTTKHAPPQPTRYHVAPVCFMCLLVPFATLEAQAVFSPATAVPYARLLGSAAAAFALNCAVFLLIGKTSALTMNVAGIVKDWLLIAASVVMYRWAGGLEGGCALGCVGCVWH
jgi:hypothetical protein